MRPILIVAGLACAFIAVAQNKSKPPLTAEQIMEKSIEASGGRKAMEQLTSTMAKGTMEIGAPDGHDHAAELVPHPEPSKMRSAVELYTKVPNKRLIVTNIDGFGQIRQGFDGTVGWNQTPQGVAEITGEALESIRRQAVFNGALKWREMYPNIELKGKEKIAGQDAYVILLTPASGNPVAQYIDAETFLMVGQSGTVDTPQGTVEIRTEMSDYRDIGNGVKAPFRLKQTMAIGEVTITMTEMKGNAEIDDAIFAKPAN